MAEEEEECRRRLLWLDSLLKEEDNNLHQMWFLRLVLALLNRLLNN